MVRAEAAGRDVLPYDLVRKTPGMTNAKAIEICGSEGATIHLQPTRYANDGVDIGVSIKILEYEFRVETFYFGINLQTFVHELELIISGKRLSATLFNYDETLILNFFHSEQHEAFLSVEYISSFPAPPTVALLMEKKGQFAKAGTSFSMSFLSLQDPIEKISEAVIYIMDNHKMDITNPYTK